MSQHDFDLANAAGSAFRADTNNAIGALLTRSSGSAGPSVTEPHMPWADTASGVMWRRNSADTAWLYEATLAQTPVSTRSSNTVLVIGDFDTTIVGSGAYTQTLTAAATLKAGWFCRYRNDGTDTITIDPDGTELIDGRSTIAMRPGQSCYIVCNGSGFKTFGLNPDEIINVDRFKPVADGSTDDISPLTKFVNSANANPGKLHVYNRAVYAISGPLPETNVSFSNIIGAGTSRHDVGATPSGTVIKAIGTAGSWAGLVMRRIRPLPGAGNQHLAGNVEWGVGYDCNDIAEVGFWAESVFDWRFNVGVYESIGTAGLILGAISGTLGEAADMQQGVGIFKGNQQRTTSRLHYGMMVTGNAIANFSLNDIYITGFHTDAPFGISQGSDNNDYFMRIYGVGAAAENWSFVGGATLAESTRQERLQFFSGNLGYVVYGTALTTVGAQDIYCYDLDKGNGTPDPVILTGATGGWKNNSNSLFGDTPFQVMNVTPTVPTGALGAVTCLIRYEKRGKRCFGNITLFGNNGSGAGAYVAIPLPFAEAGGVYWSFFGDDAVTQNKLIKGVIPAGSSVIYLRLGAPGGGYPFATGDVLNLTFNYEV